MSGSVDGMLVGLALAMSVGYAACSLGPRTLRRRVLAAVAAPMLRLPAATGLPALARRLQGAASTASSACGGCGSCDDAAAGAPPAGTPARGATPAEVRVPVSSIGKRH